MIGRTVVIVILLLLAAIMGLTAYSLWHTALAPPPLMVSDVPWRAIGALLGVLFAIVASALSYAAYRTAREGTPWE